MNSKFLKYLGLALVLCLAGASYGALAQTTGSVSKPKSTFTNEEIITKGHQFFGKASRGIGEAVEYIFQSQGEPTAYIVGEEGSGAMVGGLRFGEGTIYYKDGITQKIYWQGPSVGFDFGGNGSRTMVLVYNSDSPRELYKRFIGVEGSAYLVGGLGVNFQKNNNIVMAPIRTGVGARLGANVGYLKYSKNPTWNPF
ncbi:MAG TPA: DUF1134 domain-containing protein [Aestuariivirga sp.]|jgi:hypothetical protein|nr:DUF1134 domain-containing protein [Aestuariivirga sp.]